MARAGHPPQGDHRNVCVNFVIYDHRLGTVHTFSIFHQRRIDHSTTSNEHLATVDNNFVVCLIC